MRQLKKGLPLQAFSDCMGGRDCPANWGEFSRNHWNINQEARLHILCEEQDELCGYTEILITDPSSDHCHIDHYRKRSLFAEQTFDWTNFVVATKDDDFGANFKDNKYGIEATDYGSFLNPVTDKAESYFEYTVTGDIIPKQQGLSDSQKAIAQKTIDVFNLKHPSLISRRRAIIEMIGDYGDLPADEIKVYLTGLGFRSLIEQFT
ncbi:MAG: TIGR02646 family protein [Cytophagales bacterium]|nr:MAG: TIGR02646 family protein [Cytophagales bacterium]